MNVAAALLRILLVKYHVILDQSTRAIVLGRQRSLRQRHTLVPDNLQGLRWVRLR